MNLQWLMLLNLVVWTLVLFLFLTWIFLNKYVFHQKSDDGVRKKGKLSTTPTTASAFGKTIMERFKCTCKKKGDEIIRTHLETSTRLELPMTFV